MTAVTFNKVNLKFQKKVILEDLSFVIQKNEFFSFFGQSGSGKTSILKLISGIYKPAIGKINIFNSESPENKNGRRIVTIWQNKALFPHMNVKENIKFGLNFLDISQHEKNKRFGNMVDILNISNLLNRSVKRLSGGEQQKVAIARALIVHPDILLLDEPFNGIDELFRESFREELIDILREYKITFIMVSHDVDDILTFSERVGILEKGKLIQIGTPDAIIKDPNSVFIAKSFGEYNVLEAQVITSEDKFVHVSTALGHFKLATKKNFSVNETINILISPLDVQIVKGTDKYSVTIKRIEKTASKVEVIVENQQLRYFRVGANSNISSSFIKRGEKIGLLLNEKKMLILGE